MKEICWKEFSKTGRLVIKRKEFKSESAAQMFLAKLYQKDNFYSIVATR